MVAAKGFTPPDVFDEYRIVRSLGRGAMGQVYLGHDGLLDRPVAIKFISALDPDPLARERFLVEARAIARLSHPNVVAVYRVSQIGAWPYLVSEYLRGESLEKLPRPLPWERALEIGIGIAAGLGAAHGRGVLHRDVKPANIMLTETGEVKLLDFGLAKLLDPASAAGSPSLPARPLPSSSGDALAGTLPHEGTQADHLATCSFSAEGSGASTTRPGRSPSLTSAGVLLGTPRYMAPEAWRGEPATPRTDVYALGAVLFELCAGRPPYSEATLSELQGAVLSRDPPTLRELAPTVEPRFAQAIDRCLRRDPEERFCDGAEVHHALVGLRPGVALKLPEGNPYRGLLVFEAEHRALFFGRGAELRDLLELLRAEPVAICAGDSGVGKSSLCRAGVLPCVLEGALGEGRRWAIAGTVPGRRPAQALLDALLPSLSLAEEEARPLLLRDPSSLWRSLRRQLGAERGLLLFIDQGEELVTQAEPEEAALCVEMLNHLEGRIPGVRALLTVRGDFLTRLAALPGLRLGLSRALYLLRPLRPEGLREAVIGPARARGVRFESDALVEELVSSTVEARGGLPLLQFALAELWDHRDVERGLIQRQSLSRIGGVSGALSRHADETLSRLLVQERAAARRVLIRLVTAEGTRARRGEAELCLSPDDRWALEALVQGRLLCAHEGEGGESLYELAYEALLKGWDTLRGWLDESAEQRAAVARVGHAAAEWERLGRSREALFGARQLREAARLDPAALPPREAAFLRASRRAVSGARWRRRLLALAVPLGLLLLYGGFSLRAARQRVQEIGRHLGAARGALGEARAAAAAAEAARLRAFALFDDHKGPEGEAAWDEAQRHAAAAGGHYGRASAALETALLLDSQREDTRQLLGEALFERLILSERQQQEAQAEELRQRLESYDEDGTLRRRLEAPARLSLTTAPAGAAARLIPIERRGGRALQGPPRDLGRCPLEAQLPPGSYVLVLSLPERPDVRYPVLLHRGERLAVAVPLPARVPAGFVYVPAGRFLFGSADDDALRRSLLAAQPLHEVWTGAYFIGRNEITFADWIAFLRALPEPERLRRLPSLDARHTASDVYGAVRLEEQEGVFRLTLQPTVRAYAARAGEAIEYPARDRRRRQDWLRLPVSGISWDDAVAYAGWLDRSGQVPGARPCHEHEWERAARGADGRLYPHGDRLEGDEANIDETYGRRPLAFGPDEVGSHPLSLSPFGVADLAGNVWEWTRALDGGLLIRGGGWYQERFSARSANRHPGEASMRAVDVGLRICAPAP